jgi:hypothetical protein
MTIPTQIGSTNAPPVDARTPCARFHSSTATIPPASAPAMLCDGAKTALRSELADPSSHAPARAPTPSATK